MKSNEIITELQILVMNQLTALPPGHNYSKTYLSTSTGIKSPYLEAVLVDLRNRKIIELDHRMNDCGKLSGSGYKLTNDGRKKINSVNYLERKNEYWKKLKEKRNEKKTWLERIFS